MRFFPDIRFRPYSLDELLAKGVVTLTDDALIVNRRADGGYIPAKPLPSGYYDRQRRLVAKGIYNTAPATVSQTGREMMTAYTAPDRVPASSAVNYWPEETAIDYFPDEDWRSNSNPAGQDAKLFYLDRFLDSLDRPTAADLQWEAERQALMRELAMKKQGLI